MALVTKKPEISKKDMNFFSEFSSSAGQVASYISIALIGFIAFLFVAIVLFALVSIQKASVQNKIDKLTTEMNSEEYLEKLSSYDDLNLQLSDYQGQYYEMSQLYAKVSTVDCPKSSLLDTIFGYTASDADTGNADLPDSMRSSIASNVPLDVIITDFLYENGAITIEGTGMTMYSAPNFAHLLREQGLFVFIECTSNQAIDFSALGISADDYATATKYTFKIIGSLQSDYSVSVSKFVDGTTPTPLGAMETVTASAGTEYDITDITNIEVDGVSYTLARVLINDTALSTEDLSTAISTGALTERVNMDLTIDLYYTVSTDGGVA